MQLISHLVHKSLAEHNLICPRSVNHLRVLERQAARAIVQRDQKLLMMYTERYDDFSFPGGGIDPAEGPKTALVRELSEETGAREIEVQEAFGKVTEFVPTWKKDWDVMYQTSFWYFCAIAQQLGNNHLEDYEQANGMHAMWVTPDEALQHNRRVIEKKPSSMGLSIHRETIVLEKLRDTLIG
ncbi:NUDIX domain-containing protein [Aliidiomarina halalkaliphila]|uniref:NUDIX domain-containing protein n=1 Tax=Aliidiomarina halalkaliphila TaxID=2593535 RepID=A0A552X346_9GAMM|nr:NUDIX domain-containing protein [Aliidiomarina halalkaliphila]TRW49451.1 NUDIX domain-containing protein [Aliidiomarina halalkaliphila]